MESYFKVRTAPICIGEMTFTEEPFTIHDFIIDAPKVVKVSKNEVIKLSTIKPISTVIEVRPDESNTIGTNTTPTDVVVSDPPKVDKPKDNVNMKPKDMLSVEFVPIFPGCESLVTNKARIACMYSKIGAFVQRKFRAENFNYLDSGKKYKICVNFKIDSNGDITDIKARAVNSDLVDEGKRVIGKLPKMKPGKQGDVNVEVLYTVPIVFMVN